MINIENDFNTFRNEELRYYTIYSYADRDYEIYEKTGVNALVFMYEKAKMYNMKMKRSLQDVQDLIKERDYRGFYSLFSLDDLCVLGY